MSGWDTEKHLTDNARAKSEGNEGVQGEARACLSVSAEDCLVCSLPCNCRHDPCVRGAHGALTPALLALAAARDARPSGCRRRQTQRETKVRSEKSREQGGQFRSLETNTSVLDRMVACRLSLLNDDFIFRNSYWLYVGTGQLHSSQAVSRQSFAK